MDRTHSTTGDASSKQYSWGRDEISQLVQKIRLEKSQFAFAANNSTQC